MTEHNASVTAGYYPVTAAVRRWHRAGTLLDFKSSHLTRSAPLAPAPTAIIRRERVVMEIPYKKIRGRPDCQIAKGASNLAGSGVNPLWEPANHF